VRQAAGYLTRLLGDTGTRVDSPVDEPLGPDDDRPIDLDDVALAPIPAADPAHGVTMAAVDGGSACLVNGRSFWVIAFRAGLIRHRDRVTVDEVVDPLDLRTLTVTDAKAAYAQALARAGAVRERELADLGGVVNVLRELAEWDKVNQAIEAAAPGDVVLVDGSLHPGPFLPEPFVAPIHQAAVERGIDLVGVTKSSKLRWGRYAPLVLRIRRLAEARGLADSRWYAPITEAGDGADPAATLSEVYVARLAPRGAYAFRVDAVRGARTTEELFAVLAGASDDPAFLGYPYPLARVHQLVALPGHLLADLRRDLREHLLRNDVSEDDADLVLRDFHLTLNA
jgi:NurA domain